MGLFHWGCKGAKVYTAACAPRVKGKGPRLSHSPPYHNEAAMTAAAASPAFSSSVPAETPVFRWAVGLMSGTSLDGVDAALIHSDGRRVAAFGPAHTRPYPPDVRDAVRAILGERGGEDAIAAVERTLTDIHAEAVEELLAAAGLTAAEVAAVGFHGQTINHRPQDRHTRQIGDGGRLAARLGCPVVYDFRTADVRAGGQGAPLVPVYHQALCAGHDASGVTAVLNIGGVANVTVLADGAAPLAFDTGPGNALLDDWALRHTGVAVDRDGALARQGQVDATALTRLMEHPYFSRRPPKSLDRDDFAALARCVDGLSAVDGAATLAAFTVEACAQARVWMPEAPTRWLVCGGGRHNPALMAALRQRLAVPVDPVEVLGWDGDALEAQAFAFLALRHLDGLAQTFPETTGCPAPMGGGRLAMP